MSSADVVARWIDVWRGAFDPGKYLDLFTEDVAVYDAASGREFQGRSELAKFTQPLTQLTDMSLRVLKQAASRDDVFLEIELNAKDPAGAPANSRGVVVLTISGSKIAAVAAYLFRRNYKL